MGEVPQGHNNTGLETSLSPEIESQIVVQSSALSPTATSSQIREHCWYSAGGSLNTRNQSGKTSEK